MAVVPDAVAAVVGRWDVLVEGMKTCMYVAHEQGRVRLQAQPPPNLERHKPAGVAREPHGLVDEWYVVDPWDPWGPRA